MSPGPETIDVPWPRAEYSILHLPLSTWCVCLSASNINFEFFATCCFLACEGSPAFLNLLCLCYVYTIFLFKPRRCGDPEGDQEPAQSHRTTYHSGTTRMRHRAQSDQEEQQPRSRGAARGSSGRPTADQQQQDPTSAGDHPSLAARGGDGRLYWGEPLWSSTGTNGRIMWSEAEDERLRRSVRDNGLDDWTKLGDWSEVCVFS